MTMQAEQKGKIATTWLQEKLENPSFTFFRHEADKRVDCAPAPIRYRVEIAQDAVEVLRPILFPASEELSNKRLSF